MSNPCMLKIIFFLTFWYIFSFSSYFKHEKFWLSVKFSIAFFRWIYTFGVMRNVLKAHEKKKKKPELTQTQSHSSKYELIRTQTFLNKWPRFMFIYKNERDVFKNYLFLTLKWKKKLIDYDRLYRLLLLEVSSFICYDTSRISSFVEFHTFENFFCFMDYGGLGRFSFIHKASFIFLNYGGLG